MQRKIKESFKNLLQTVLPFSFYVEVLGWYCKNISHTQSTTFMLSKGHSKQKFIIFRCDIAGCALFAAANRFLSAADWAEKNGMIPILDITYGKEIDAGTFNSPNIGSLFFRQDLKWDEIYTKKWVCVTNSWKYEKSTCVRINGDADDTAIHADVKERRTYFSEWHKLSEKYWVVNQDILDEVYEYWNKHCNGSVVMGVFMREEFSDEANKYRSEKKREIYVRHPLVPGVSEIIEIVKKKMKQWGIDRVFLSTIYNETVEVFKDELKDRVIVVDRERMMFNMPQEEYNNSDKEEAYKHIKKIGGESYIEKMWRPYLIEVLLLSKCDYLIASKGGGASAAMVFNGGEYKDVVVLGETRENKAY